MPYPLKKRTNTRKSQEQFEKELSEVNPNIIVTGKYVNLSTPLGCKCSKCGRDWQAWPADLLRGSLGCLCSKAPRRNKEEFIQELARKNKDVELIGPFTRMNVKTTFKCSVCGYQWETVPQSVLRGTGCRRCAVERLKAPRITEREFSKRVEALCPDVEVLGKYTGSSHRVEARCKKCGHVWSPRGGLLYRGKTGCIKCAGNMKKSHETFVSEMKEVNPHIEIIGRYTNAKSKVKCRCLVCGSEFEMKANNLMNGQGCPACRRINQTSFPEQAIAFYTKQVFPDTINSHTDFGYELDVFIPSKNIGIEYDGLKWHSNKTENDHKKNRKCLADGITLIRIREPGLEVLDDCVCIVREKLYSSESLDKCIEELLIMLNAPHISVDVNRDSLDIQSQYRRRRKGGSFAALFPKEAGEWNYEMNGALTPEMFSPGSKQRVWWVCEICNHVWETSVYDRSRGHGCPVCARIRTADKERKPVEVFLEELKDINPNVIPLEDYKGAQEPLLCRCATCNHEWKVRPASLLCHQTGCPKCAHVRTANAQRKTNETFLKELASKNPNVEALQPYRGAHEKILVRCKLCGNEWPVSPANITRGKNCPVCHGKKI